MAVDKHGDLIPGFYPGVRVHPTPIYESALYLAVFLVLRRMQKRTRVEGRVSYIFLMLYGASCFLVEFLRINPRLLLGLSEAQLISLVMMIAGGASYAASITRHPPASPMVGEA